jgi:hypothetical protein
MDSLRIWLEILSLGGIWLEMLKFGEVSKLKAGKVLIGWR